MNGFKIRSIEPSDELIVASLLEKHWGSRQVVSRGKVQDAAKLSGFVALDGDEIVGLVTLHPDPAGCEVVTLDAFVQGRGLGSALLSEAEKFARFRGCGRLWLITSNDNVGALTFYQKLGFRMVAIHREAITEARKLKPQIPLVGENGIPIKDEIELEKLLSDAE